MRIGASGKSLSRETDAGAGPATAVPPSPFTATDDEATFPTEFPDGSSASDDGGAALEIEKEFRRRLSGLRGRPKRERALAYRKAKEWYRQAIAALKEKERITRRAANTVRFADKVGDVLSMGSAKGAEKQPFKYYV
jgi:hypothetical protein